MIEEVKDSLKSAIKHLYGVDVEPELTRPEEQFGDYASNLAMKLSKDLSKTPRDVAQEIADRLKEDGDFKDVQVAGPGFINLTLKDEDIIAATKNSVNLPKPLAGQEVIIEYGDPNPFKEMHIGHAYSYIVGDAIASLLESGGAEVKRLSYHGDVGLHVAKAIWAIRASNIDWNKGGSLPIGSFYSSGNKAYEQDDKAKAEIDEINRKIYDQSDPEVNEIYQKGKETSFAYFDQILQDLGIKPARRFLESASAKKGLELVSRHPEVFELSDGATVYKGEKAGLHTRVFITSAGLPTYEAKDLGLAELKKEAYPHAARSIIITAHEQVEYFKVMLAALREFDPKTADITTHLYHGFVSLSSGKMSSRTGNVYGAKELIDDVKNAATKIFPNADRALELAAIKYGFLRHRLGSDIVYDIEESVSLEGSSGPYLQYAHARARSILAKSSSKPGLNDLDEPERSLARKISEYQEVTAKATAELMPHHIASYLYELSQSFNRFYEGNRVLGDSRETARLALVETYADVLRSGLNILNIEAPEKV